MRCLLARVTTIGLSVALFLVGALSGPADANAPVAIPFYQQFTAPNPCMGVNETVTVAGTLYLLDNEGGTVAIVDRSISTTSGYEGSGTSTSVVNSQVQKLSLRDVLTNGSGSR